MAAQILATIIFLIMFGFIITEKAPRHLVTLVCAAATLLLVFGVCMHSISAVWETLNLESFFHTSFWYSAEASESGGINWETIVFLAGMMIMVEGMADSGFFQWLCITIAKAVHYRPFPIFLTFMLLSAALSMFIDSITVILFLSTVTIELGQLLKFDPVPAILAEVFCANLGGSATMCGDPPNIIIGTSLGYSFGDFITHTGLIAGICLLLVIPYFCLCFHKEFKSAPVQELNLDPKDAINDPKEFFGSCAIFLAAVLLLSWFGARTIVACGGDAATGLSTGELLSLLSYATQILMSLMGLSMIFVMLTMSRTSGERVVELLNETPDITTPENAVKSVPDGSIDFEHVQFSYRHGTEGKPVLSDINLHIPAGATVGVIGGTGSSKSSFVQLIPRLYDVDLGAVKVGGIDVRKYDLDTLRGDVAMVLQKNVLFSGTIKDNLRWGDENATDEEILHACQLAQADDFIQTFPKGYDTYIEQGGTNVSGGQKQRLCIARALLKKPKILILDDSTSAVDTRTDALIRGAFAKEIPNTTKIIIAQRIASVQGADMILVLDDGKIVSCGTHDELMQTSPIYREVYESQTKGDPDNATAS